MTNKEAKDLLERYREGHCTGEEKALLEAWYVRLAREREFPQTEADIEEALKEISARLPFQQEKRTWPRGQLLKAAAVCGLLALTAAAYFFLPALRKHPTPDTANIYKNDVSPGTSRAMLELDNGTRIDLEEAELGSLNVGGETLASKTENDQLVYKNTAGKEKTSRRPDKIEPVYNTIRTPRGGYYKVVLPDGSEAWLNAASSIRFPVPFGEDARRVEITGEVYFDVIHKPGEKPGEEAVPFIVNLNGHTVEVLGTRFNINAYPEEGKVRTTLVEGSVKINRTGSGQSSLLRPGQQAEASEDPSAPFLVKRVNVEEAVAWQKGLFQYEMAGLESIMREVSRWYDVEVVYEGAVPDRKFVGTISRDISLSAFLDILSFTGVKFRIEGKKIFVLGK